MDHSMAQPPAALARLDMPLWKTWTCSLSAVLLGLLFLVAGVWKITDPFGAATRMNQALVPYDLSLPAAVAFGIAETTAAVFLFVPSWRRWGAWLAGVMLVAFLAYIGIHYETLRGQECNCFPWIKRAVGPAFFVSDLAMLAMAAAAAVWARPSQGLRSGILALAAVSVFAGVSVGVMAARQTGAAAPDAIVVDGRLFSLQSGRVFIYFFDPECSHCDAAARAMAQYRWRAKLVAVATAQPQFARAFLASTGFPAGVSEDLDKLKAAFAVPSGPFGVAIERGRQAAAIRNFDAGEPAETLRQLGFIE